MQMIHMEFQVLFSLKNNKNNIKNIVATILLSVSTLIYEQRWNSSC